jgi:hypothetical protein
VHQYLQRRRSLQEYQTQRHTLALQPPPQLSHFHDLQLPGSNLAAQQQPFLFPTMQWLTHARNGLEML